MLGSMLFNFARALFAIAFAGQRLFCTTLFTRLQIKRVTLNLFHNVLLLDLAFEAP